MKIRQFEPINELLTIADMADFTTGRSVVHGQILDWIKKWIKNGGIRYSFDQYEIDYLKNREYLMRSRIKSLKEGLIHSLANEIYFLEETFSPEKDDEPMVKRYSVETIFFKNQDSLGNRVKNEL